MCRLLVNADVVPRTGDDEVALVLEPALNEFGLREMWRCLQGARVQHLVVEVVEAQTAVRQGATGPQVMRPWG